MLESTRSKWQADSIKAIIEGLASDGGLYVPTIIPNISYKELINKTYEEVATIIIHSYFNEFTKEEITSVVKNGYKDFNVDTKVQLTKADEAYFLELFHGPTLSFKDMALSVLPGLFSLAKNKSGIKEEYTVLIATSGDTGSAALHGFKDITGIKVIVLYPNGGISEAQERQMLSYKNNNNSIIAISGNFDDCQRTVKDFFNENKNLKLSSANSINIARLIGQIVYYYYSYLDLLTKKEIKEDEKINFVVPTGNFGNILAAYMAKMMGLPINNLICASNKNNILTEFFQKGVYDLSRDFYKTNSPAMDIIISSNLERFIYFASNKDKELVSKLMNDLINKGQFYFKNNDIFAYCANDEETKEMIKLLYDKNQKIIDTHTAVAYKAYLDYKNETNDLCKTVIVSTASPLKFSSSVLEALNISEGKTDSENIRILKKLLPSTPTDSFNHSLDQKKLIDLKEIKDYLKELIKC